MIAIRDPPPRVQDLVSSPILKKPLGEGEEDSMEVPRFDLKTTNPKLQNLHSRP